MNATLNRISELKAKIDRATLELAEMKENPKNVTETAMMDEDAFQPNEDEDTGLGDLPPSPCLSNREPFSKLSKSIKRSPAPAADLPESSCSTPKSEKRKGSPRSPAPIYQSGPNRTPLSARSKKSNSQEY